MHIDTLRAPNGTFRLCERYDAQRALAAHHVTHLCREQAINGMTVTRTVVLRRYPVDEAVVFDIDYNDPTYPAIRTNSMDDAIERVMSFLNWGKTLPNPYGANDRRKTMREINSKTMKNGAIEVARIQIDDKIAVLADTNGVSGHPWATWRMDEDGNTFWGHYFDTRDEAVKDMLARV